MQDAQITRLFGGVLCANCTADVVKLGSRVEQGEMKLDDISTRARRMCCSS